MANAGFMVREALKNRTLLPFEHIPSPMISCAENAIRVAWQALTDTQLEYGIDLSKDNESLISYKLVQILNFLCRGVNKPSQEFVDFVEYFEAVNVGSGYQDYKGRSIMQPDFVLRPRNNPNPGLDAGYYAIFVEAKIIGITGQQTSAYFQEGVERFLDGRYAWAMPHGLMVAYVRSGQVVFDALSDYLNGKGHVEIFNVKQLPVFAKVPNRSPKVCVTVHERKWKYDNRSGTPGNIEIRHLWLDTY